MRREGCQSRGAQRSLRARPPPAARHIGDSIWELLLYRISMSFLSLPPLHRRFAVFACALGCFLFPAAQLSAQGDKSAQDAGKAAAGDKAAGKPDADKSEL